jgi:predicted acetyltransferase
MSASSARSGRARRGEPSPLTVRRARKRDLDRVLEIHGAAFPDPRPVEVRRRVFLMNKFGGFQHLRVAERAGEVVAHAFLFPMEVWACGRRAPAVGIASVGVAPEARGAGIGKALLASLHDEAEATGAAFSLLYPFRQGFYASLGYGPVSRQRVLTLSPSSIPREWATALRGTVRRMHGDDAAGVARLYESQGQLGSGFLARTRRLWESYLLDERRQWLVLDDGTLSGYVCFVLHQTEEHARIRAEVLELVAPTDPARRRLLASIAGLRDQVGDVTLTLADGDPIDWAFVDPDRDRAGTLEIEHPLGVVSGGPMLRLIGPASIAARSRGYTNLGKLNVAVEDEPVFELSASGQGRSASIGRAGRGPTLKVTRSVFASIALGGLSVHDAARLGWLPDNDSETCRLADVLFEAPPFFTLDAF